MFVWIINGIKWLHYFVCICFQRDKYHPEIYMWFNGGVGALSHKAPLAEQYSMFQWKQLLVLKLCHSKYFPGRCYTSTPQAKWLQTLWRFSMSVFWVCFWSNGSPGRAMAAPQLYSKVREFKPRYFHIWAAETCATMNHPNCPILQHFSVGNFKLSNRIN